ncbi:hypothetical protein CFB40_32345 [Burkholderia sp. AU31652]|uniref:Lipoprotein n=1 Tax=Burkholderia contaminans TaxID=488447 RepID=A0A6P2VBW2_9BURK|nr:MULTISPECIES: hypothetical protein [Burkholderia]MDN7488654.1 hypothetical protein [Burkholderia sp. AU45274]OXI79049.1 hypothetical protein CFB40_32345 [Burkholderia sp. AU31652]OXJ07262.1 hypothetical protein CFB45_34270 [Burkholderia sp. HI2500]VWC79110.1 hypothetical protein BCO71171_00336 [Burkholderia contaminans]
MKQVLQCTVATLRTALGAAAAGLVLSACGSTQMNMVDVQTSTAKTLGLASSDEITIANVQYGKKDGLGGQKVGYDATTGKGRRFGCTVFMIPGLTPIDRPTYNNWECHPQR